MKSKQARDSFLSFFKKKGHAVVPSSPVAPHDDPTLLFVNAGMNQFKDVFLGKNRREYTRAASSQKCVRVGGKHNDLENVGHTSRHLTFFEMLGNFSFGDYFKKEAIDFAWEVTRSIFQFESSNIWATVFFEDEEAFELWTRYLPKERIVRMGEKDNFWAMGETGPCGPCSELLYDRGMAFGSARSPAEDIKGERYLEFWNLVFMQYNRDANGNLDSLPKPCVDTGAGLERVISLCNGVDSLFETDILRSLIAQVENVSGKPYHSKQGSAFRVIADHLRSLSFAIADGVSPSNLDRGYVLRKILRRAVRYGKQLGFDKPFLGQIFPRLKAEMGNDFPELKSAEERILETLLIEEEGFFKTLKRGGAILSQIIERSKKDQSLISGEDAFKLKDTYGLPLEEILLLAKDDTLSVDILRFEELEKEAKERSKSSRKTIAQTSGENLFASFYEEHGATTFSGYSEMTCESVVLAIYKEDRFVPALYAGEEGIVFLDKTPFYAEKGGQVGDTGILFSQEGQFSVIDCKNVFPEVIGHLGVVQEGQLRVGQLIIATIDAQRRKKIEGHHSATHLLHWALQQVLGTHIRQAGSIVEASRLRFDFSHHKALSKEEIFAVEDLVNEKIREDISVKTFELSYEEAQKNTGIKQFFGDKYGSRVRVVAMQESQELCGGTHVSSTGTLGYFRITKESSIAAGVRRIEAVVGREAEQVSREQETLLSSLSQLLKSSQEHLLEKMNRLLEDQKELATQLALSQKKLLNLHCDQWLLQKKIICEVPTLIVLVQCKAKELKEASELLADKLKESALLLITIDENRCHVVSKVSKTLVQKGISAHEWISAIFPLLEGRGGGKADMAQGSGAAVEKVSQALSHAEEWLRKKCQSIS